MLNKVERANRLYLRKLAAKSKATRAVKAITEIAGDGKNLTKNQRKAIEAASKGFTGNAADMRGIVFKPSNKSAYVLPGVDPTVTRTISINPDGSRVIHKQLTDLAGKKVFTKVTDTLKSGAVYSLVPGALDVKPIKVFGAIPADPSDKASAVLGKLVSKAEKANDVAVDTLTTRGSKLWGATKDKGKKLVGSVKKHPIISTSLAVLGGGSWLTHALLSDSDKEDTAYGEAGGQAAGQADGKKSDGEGFKHWGALGGGTVGGIGAALAAWELLKNRAEWERWLYTSLAAAGGAAAGGFAGSLLDSDDDKGDDKDSKDSK